MNLEDYAGKYEDATITRDEQGVLTCRFGTDGGPMLWSERTHRELPLIFHDIASDPDTRVVVMTGTGDEFLTRHVGQPVRDEIGWDKKWWEGRHLLSNYLDIRVPVIFALNGPCTSHSEIPILADIVLATEDTILQDRPHLPNNIVPGDGVHLAWPMVLGPNRGRYFLLTGEILTAQQAKDLGVVGEVLPRDELMPRAYELAAMLASKSTLTLRYTRAVLTMLIRRMMQEDVGYGLALEGAAMIDMMQSVTTDDFFGDKGEAE